VTKTQRFKIPEVATLGQTDQAIAHLRTYFGLNGHAAYTGAHFERLGGGGDRVEARDVLCADDLIAVRMLSVDVNASAALQLLEDKSAQITDLLSLIPADVELVDAPDDFFEAESAARRLWRLFNDEPGIGWVTAGKLLARKRPRLIPVFDSVVRASVGGGASYWKPLAKALAADGMRLQDHLGCLRSVSGIGEDISIIRAFDVIVWMDGREQSRAA
jgi:hypothetical protein